jgi:ubiquinone/menaquinone biosynthesis C-methylase UbiE
MSDKSKARAFSEKLHLEGRWDTRVLHCGPFSRALWNFISFKRSGISELALRCKEGSVGLDLGCGKGAYARWFTGIRKAKIVCADWSFTALCQIEPMSAGGFIRVCADAGRLPFKPGSFDFFYTVDVLGHVDNPDTALDEVLRVTRMGAPFFLHSECADYRSRWPDRALIARLKTDCPAAEDGHGSLRTSAEIYKSLLKRFTVESFFSPAGLAGWLIGYPEKYHAAFKAASWKFLAALTAVFAALKAAPVIGAVLRLKNAVSNRMELFFGIVGGGSCFARGTVPDDKQ